jgi:hypothetical protein
MKTQLTLERPVHISHDASGEIRGPEKIFTLDFVK